MKYIVSLFFVLCAFSARAQAPLLSFAAAFYAPQSADAVCFVKWKPSSSFSLYTGNLSFGGLWSSFSNPAFSSAGALPQGESAKSVLSIQGGNTGPFPFFCAAEAAFPGGRFTAFAGCEKKSQKKQRVLYDEDPEYRLQAGAGLVFPFTVKKTLDVKKADAEGYWALAWKRVYIDAPRSTLWFIRQTPFKSFYAQTLIQSFMIKGKTFKCAAENGWAENPYGKPAFFISAKIFRTTGVFLYNAGFFLCSNDYLKQNGSFEKKRIQFFLNPQLAFMLPFAFPDTVRCGAIADVFYTNEWIMETGAALTLQGKSCTLSTDVRFPSVGFTNTKEKYRPVLQKPADCILKTKLDFVQTYEDFFTCKWSAGGTCTFAMSCSASRPVKSYGFNAGFKSSLKIKKQLRCSASLSVQTDLPAAAVRIKTGAGTEPALRLKDKPRFASGVNAEFLLKRGVLQKAEYRVHLKIRYN